MGLSREPLFWISGALSLTAAVLAIAEYVRWSRTPTDRRLANVCLYLALGINSAVGALTVSSIASAWRISWPLFGLSFVLIGLSLYFQHKDRKTRTL